MSNLGKFKIGTLVVSFYSSFSALLLSTKYQGVSRVTIAIGKKHVTCLICLDIQGPAIGQVSAKAHSN